MIEVNNLVKQFGSVTAVDGITFHVEKGEILGFLGQNGAGKTTTMKMLTSYIKPTSGTASVAGYSILDASLEVRKNIGYLPESSAFYDEMKVFEFLNFIADIRELRGMEKKRRIAVVMDVTNLLQVQSSNIAILSKGFKQRVGFAQALIHDPPILIMDEPLDGLDPNQKFEARGIIKEMKQKKAMIISTHILEEMESICNRAIIIDKGKLVANDTPAGLLKHSKMYNAITIHFEKGLDPSFVDSLKEIPEVVSVETLSEEDLVFRIFPKERASILSSVTSLVTSKEVKVLELFQEKGQMDEVFRTMTADKKEN